TAFLRPFNGSPAGIPHGRTPSTPRGVWKPGTNCRNLQSQARVAQCRSLPKGRPRTSRPRAILSPKWFYVNCPAVGRIAYSAQEVLHRGDHPDDLLELGPLIHS